MKKRFLTLVVLLCLYIFPAKAQSFQEYIQEFPLITKELTWKDTELAKYPIDNQKKILDDKYRGLVGGTGEWGQNGEDIYGTRVLYPLGRIESGSAVIVFFLTKSSGYKEDYDTQISVDSFAYNKKSGDLLRGGMNHYMLSVGGDVTTRKFMYTGMMTVSPEYVTIEQTGEGDVITKNERYKVTGKGLSFE